MKLDYSDLDIVCSDRLLRSDKDLENRVVAHVNKLGNNHDERVENVRDFYGSYLCEKLDSVDKKGAHVDFSTLALAAGRKKFLNFIQVYDALKADYAYFMERAKKEVVESDMLAWANRTLDLYLTFGEMHNEQVELFRKTIREHKDWFADKSFQALKIDVNKSASDVDEFTSEFYKWLDSQ